MTVIAPSALVAERALRAGDVGRAWLAGLPELLAGLEQDWAVTATEQLGGGNESIVLRVRPAAVLKLVPPGTDLVPVIRLMSADRGRAYARLLAHDADRGALLLEELGQSLAELGTATDDALDVLGALLPAAWQSAGGAPAHGKAQRLAGDIAARWEALGRPCARAVRDRALACAARRAAPPTTVVVHGDPHPGNALERSSGGYALVDPDGFVDDPAYDLGVVLRDWCPQLLAGDPQALMQVWIARLAAATGADPGAIADWAYLERVSTGLYLLDLGAAEAARPFLATAAALS